MAEHSNETSEALPESFQRLISGLYHSGDCERAFDEKPDWLDMEKFRRGQKFAKDYMFAVFYSEVVGLLAVYNHKEELKPLIFTGKSATVYAAFKRYLSTVLRFRRWFTQDSWDKNTEAAKDISHTRSMHTSTRQKLGIYSCEEFESKVKIENAWCPALDTIFKDFSDISGSLEIHRCPQFEIENNPDRPKYINQTDMAISQWSFFGLLVTYPKSFGIHRVTDDDLEAYCHLWRSIGYQLGIADEQNFARGTLEEIRRRSEELIDYWIKPNFRTVTPEWEHMCRCFVTSMGALCPLYSFEAMLLHLAEMMSFKMPRLYASLSCTDWIKWQITKILYKFATRVPGVHGLLNVLMNFVINRAEKFTPGDLKAMEVKFSNYNKKESRVRENSSN